MSVNLNLERAGSQDYLAQLNERVDAQAIRVTEALCSESARPIMSWIWSAGVFCASDLIVRSLQHYLPGSSPQVLLMLAPVLQTGVRHGRLAAMGAWLATAAVSGLSLLPHAPGTLQFADQNSALSFALLVAAGPVLASVSGRCSEARRALEVSEQRRIAFSQEVLLAATGGRLRLSTPDDLRSAVLGPAAVQYPLRSLDDVSLVRSRVRVALEARGASCDRLDDLLMCVTEAATNSLKHAGGGSLSLWISETKISAMISDQGEGISPVNLARATLEAGFSTQGTLGMGFTLMIAMCDTLMLSTSPKGTEILIEITRPAAG
ncbi:MAG: ATP-binding protein [Capsulimonas sp.]|uniref:ATP-binding protein n=1 Tax=Capsulimonas sp. TaxID=2494211 RepID=UPI0032633E12